MPADPCSGISNPTSIAAASEWRCASMLLIPSPRSFGGMRGEDYRQRRDGPAPPRTSRDPPVRRVPCGRYAVSEPTQPSLIPELAYALSRAERSVTRQLSRALQAEGWSVEHWRILLLLGDAQGHPMTEIAEFALVPAPSVTRLIDRMVTEGIVHRTADPRDRRRVLVHLTPRGRALQLRLDKLVAREQSAVLAGAAPADTEPLARAPRRRPRRPRAAARPARPPRRPAALTPRGRSSAPPARVHGAPFGGPASPI